MTNFSNSSIYLSNVVDNFFHSVIGDFIEPTTHFTTTDGTGYYNYTTYSPIEFQQWEAPKIDVPNYPVSNVYITPEGTTKLELAVTGFSKKYLTVKAEGNILRIIGKRPDIPADKDGNTSISPDKCIHSKISTRDFDNSYQCTDKMDLDSIQVSLENGILEVHIPLKEEEKPVIKEFEIK